MDLATMDDRHSEMADALMVVFEENPLQDFSPSQAAAKAAKTYSGIKVTTNDAHNLLPALAKDRYLVAHGNGAWTRYRRFNWTRDLR